MMRLIILTVTFPRCGLWHCRVVESSNWGFSLSICFIIHSFQIKQNRPALLSFSSAAILFPVFSFLFLVKQVKKDLLEKSKLITLATISAVNRLLLGSYAYFDA